MEPHAVACENEDMASKVHMALPREVTDKRKADKR
jgi:hypothetical protein